MQEDLDNLTFRGHNDGKRNGEKQGITYLTSMCKWLVKKGFREMGKRQNLLSTTKKRKLSWVIFPLKLNSFEDSHLSGTRNLSYNIISPSPIIYYNVIPCFHEINNNSYFTLCCLPMVYGKIHNNVLFNRVPTPPSPPLPPP